MKEFTIIVDPIDKINQHMKERMIKIGVLANKIDISRPYLSLILRRKMRLNEKTLKKINEGLGTDFSFEQTLAL